MSSFLKEFNSKANIITLTDFVITNANGKTTFQFRTPSEGGVNL